MQVSMVPWLTWSARMRTESGGGEAEGPACHKTDDDLKDWPGDVAPLPDRLESSAFWFRPQGPLGRQTRRGLAAQARPRRWLPHH
jgi:hypothetical protein